MGEAVTAEEAARITAERLAGWRERLNGSTATPMVLLGVGHGDRSGELVVLIPEGVDAGECAALCGHAAVTLAKLAEAEAIRKATGG